MADLTFHTAITRQKDWFSRWVDQFLYLLRCRHRPH